MFLETNRDLTSPVNFSFPLKKKYKREKADWATLARFHLSPRSTHGVTFISAEPDRWAILVSGFMFLCSSTPLAFDHPWSFFDMNPTACSLAHSMHLRPSSPFSAQFRYHRKRCFIARSISVVYPERLMSGLRFTRTDHARVWLTARVKSISAKHGGVTREICYKAFPFWSENIENRAFSGLGSAEREMKGPNSRGGARMLWAGNQNLVPYYYETEIQYLGFLHWRKSCSKTKECKKYM